MEDRRDERGDGGAGDLADQLEQDADRLRERGDELDSEIEGARHDWDAKQGEGSVPGAQEEAAVRDDVAADDDESGSQDDADRQEDADRDDDGDHEAGAVEDETDPAGDAG